MAVTTNGNVVKMTAVGDKLSSIGFGRVRVKTISWRGMTSGGQCVLNAGEGGQEIYNNTATGNNDDDEQIIDGWLNDIYVTTLGSGSVYVYLD